jgi:ABC-type multidrug transport system ATPase subunit
LKLEVQHVCKQYFGNDNFKLNDISFTLNQYDFVGIIGKNGSGKSTLLSLITGYQNYDYGKITFNGKIVEAPPITLLQGVKGIKIIHQDLKLIQYYTVRENLARQLIAYQNDYKIEKVNEYLKKFKLEAVADLKIEQISGGQKQKLAIANALIEETELLILDEPFNNLDDDSRSELIEILMGFKNKQNIGCIMVSHQVSDVLMLCDQLLLLENGNQLAFEKTQFLYQQIENKSIAKFFGEVYTVVNEGNTIHFRANECIVCSSVNAEKQFEGKIIERLFNGRYFLYTCSSNNGNFFKFFDFEEFTIGENLCFKLNKMFDF